MATRIELRKLIDKLHTHHGKPSLPRLAGPWEMILWENVAYLADAAKRAQAFKMLKKTIGVEPKRILAADDDDALLEVTRHGALDSNGLRVLLRLGYGEEKKSYAAMYRLVQKDAEAKREMDCPKMQNAHMLLRIHGQAICRRTTPLCDECPLASYCAYFRNALAAQDFGSTV